MGPRARRRLGWLVGAAAALVVAGGVIYHVTDSGGSTAATGSSSGRRLEIGTQSAGIAFGASRQDVLRKLGPPSTKQAACLVYRATNHAVHGEYLGELVDGLKYCFADGPAGGKAVAGIYEHVLAHTFHHKHIPAGWSPAITLMPHQDPAS
jgi:hypothetical protein